MNKVSEILAGELIGLPVEAIGITNKTIATKGFVIDETKNILIVKSAKGVLKLIKDQCMFTFIKGGARITVPGSDIVSQPEERVKKWLKKRRRKRVSESK